MQPYPVPVPHESIPKTGIKFDSSTAQSLARFDRFYINRPNRWVAFFLIAYGVAALCYAAFTPAWQNPDEPAHYNYVAHIAEQGRLPVLHEGDYDQSLIDLLLATHFAPKIPTSSLRYESYQPPLYYLTATPIYWFSDGSLFALRLYNVFLGAMSLLLLYHCVALVFPQKSLLSVGALAFAATLPMHVAMTSAVNNDGLAELLTLASMLVLLQWMRDQFYEVRSLNDSVQRRRLLILGLLLGLGLLTKIYAYALLPICLGVIVFVSWRRPRATGGRPRGSWKSLWRGIQLSLLTAIPALLLALPLWIRNLSLYGRWDLLGLNQHDEVVIGQPRTAEWIATFGWVEFGERALQFTFQSFWGVFGWMGVFMDQRIYLAVLVFSGVIFAGVLWAAVRLISGPPDTDMDRFQITVLALFALLLAAVVATYIAYNIKFVQHQGRYFFWGILPISLVVALGWREVLHPLQGWITGLLAAVLASSIMITGLFNDTLDKWTVLIIGLVSLMLLLQPLLLAGTSLPNMRWLPQSIREVVTDTSLARLVGGLRALIWALPFLALWVLNLTVPWLYILPQLGG